MNALAIDTATEVLALAAASGDTRVSLSLNRGLQHAPVLIPLIDRLLKDVGLSAADLQLIACSLGPGSFTGIRIGLATALGIGHERDIPIVGVSTLEALAIPWTVWQGEVFPVIDARKGNIYAARFRAGERVTEYMDLSPDRLRGLLETATRPLLVGPDAERIRSLIGGPARDVPCARVLDPEALLRIGIYRYNKEGAAPDRLRPLYLRKSEAEITSGL
jgi:tRNA threonylcarbamoyladenosine biosynthesis protein TsaB